MIGRVSIGAVYSLACTYDSKINCSNTYLGSLGVMAKPKMHNFNCFCIVQEAWTKNNPSCLKNLYNQFKNATHHQKSFY
jgi:hypothetical protein